MMYTNHIIVDFEMNPVMGEERKGELLLTSEIIQIGAVKLDKELRTVSTFSRFVHPALNYQVTPQISRLTGIHSSSALKADGFDTVLADFVDWIGYGEKTRIYSWSSSDLDQLTDECYYKDIPFPGNMRRWLDVQKVFPRMMNITRSKKQIALKEAARYFDVKVDSSKAHNALYDAEITARILIPLLNGEYREQVECTYRLTHGDSGASSLGDVCGGVLAELLRQMNGDRSQDAEE